MTEIQDYQMGEFETLYHYTSADGLKSIIENKTLRFSDYRFLNDIDELEYGKKVFSQVLDELKNQEPKYIDYISQWESELKSIEQGKIKYLKPVSPGKNGTVNCIQCESQNYHYYILSLTVLGDNKDMWNMYSGNNPGYRIKIKGNELMNYFYSIRDSYMSKGILFSTEHRMPVFYGEEAIEYIKNALKIEFINGNSSISQFGSIFKYLAFVKDEAFRSESEYRLGFCFVDEMDNSEINRENAKKVFMNKNGTIYPYMEFQNFPFDKIVEEIMISPYNKSELAEIGLKEFLRANKLENVKIKRSEIRIR
ncbi:DUF2971 domain-containing protein [Treponema zioleckii]|uniref:DUF2971 domain-containing protein n=1 Tax=Treponema zioleckii TaxID=331680 RepID=UPI00168BB5FF|nr:DUF2971 domain-containing protein [Treponema zioleckii]